MDTPSKLLLSGASLLGASIPLIGRIRSKVKSISCLLFFSNKTNTIDYSSVKLCMGALLSSSFLSIGTFLLGVGMVGKMLNVSSAKEFTQLVEDKIDKRYDLFGAGIDDKIDSYLNK